MVFGFTIDEVVCKASLEQFWVSTDIKLALSVRGNTRE